MDTQQIKSLFKDCDLSSRLHGGNYRSRVVDFLSHDFKFEIRHGASKLVVIPAKADFVIKVPFDCCFLESDSSMYSASSPNDDCFIVDFSCANNDCRFCWDYCLQEVLIYNKAQKRGVHKAFAKTRHVCDIQGRPIYIQQLATPLGDSTHPKASKDSRNKVEKLIEKYKYDDLCPGWQAHVIDYYGERFFRKLMEFLIDEEVEDLHSHNIGFSALTGNPLLIDYSSFNN